MIDITTVIKLLMLIMWSLFFIYFVSEVCYWLNSIDSGEVFGIQIAAGKRNVTKIIISGILCFLFGGVAIGTMINLLFSNFRIFVIYFVLLVGTSIISMICNYKSGIEKCAKEKNALILGELDLIKHIDSEIELSDSFFVGYTDVEVCSQGEKEKICYSSYGYSLSSERELALLGMYFLQRHHSKFEMKVDSEAINSYVVHENMTSGKRYVDIGKERKVLNGYIFTRR